MVNVAAEAAAGPQSLTVVRRASDALLASTGYQPATDAERVVIDQFVARSRVLMDRSAGKLTSRVPDARVVYLGNVGHFVFITREAEVLKEIRAFLTRPVTVK